MTFTMNPKQALAIKAQYDALAKTPLTQAAAVAHIFTDNADSEMEESGYTTVELTQYETKSGRTESFNVYTDEVSID